MDIDADDNWVTLPNSAGATGFSASNQSNNEAVKPLATLADSRWATLAAGDSSFSAGVSSQTPNSIGLNGPAGASNPSGQFRSNSAVGGSYVASPVGKFGFNGGAEDFKPLNSFAPASTWSTSPAAPAINQSGFGSSSNNGWSSNTSESTAQSGRPASSNHGWLSYNTSISNPASAAPAWQPAATFYTTSAQLKTSNPFTAQPGTQAQASTNATAAIVERAGKKVSFLKDSKWAC
jgi:hypothetical protein